MSWVDLLQNPDGIRATFDSVPSLEGVAIHEIVLNWDGPRAHIRFDIQEFPVRPPATWVTQQCNTVQLQLQCIGIRSLNLKGWGTRNEASLSVTAGDDGMLTLLLESDETVMELQFDFLVLDRISAYKDVSKPHAT